MSGDSKQPKTASLYHERQYLRAGCHCIIGIDEAGRGPLAGPVAAAAVALPLERKDLSSLLRGVRDSKDMSARQREAVDATIKELAVAWGIGCSSAAEIDRQGIVPATKAAMQRALEQALANSHIQPDCLFLDYMLWPERRDIPQVSIVDGDKHSLSIASASVIAKVWRDARMRELDACYPQYGFARHKGYATDAHRRALRRFGPVPSTGAPSSQSGTLTRPEATRAFVVSSARKSRGDKFEARAGTRLAESDWRRGRCAGYARAPLSGQSDLYQHFPRRKSCPSTITAGTYERFGPTNCRRSSGDTRCTCRFTHWRGTTCDYPTTMSS